MSPFRQLYSLVIILSLFLLFPFPAGAKKKTAVETETSAPADNPWYIGLGLGANAPISGWDANYLLGGGGTLFAGVKLDDSFSLQLNLDYSSFAGGSTSLFDLRFFPVLRWNLGGGGLHPYFLAGPGYDLHSDTPSGYSTSALAASVGAGLEYDLAKKDHLFLEARTELLFYQDVTLQDVPVTAGLRVDL